MARKIYDIKPPKRASSKSEKEIKEFLDKPKERKKISKRKKEVRPLWQPIVIIGSVVVVLVAVYLFFKLPKADIEIWPKIDSIALEKTITADKTADAVDTVKLIIPAKTFQVSKTNSQEFPATGNASNEGKASGTITIYNKFDPPAPLTFKAGTHFMSDSGKLFVSSQKVVIPAGKKSGGKVTPGSVQIKVTAVEGGEDYNIAPASFSIPGLKGTSYYYSVYATSTTAMSGGYATAVKKVTEDDISSAKDTVSQKSITDAIEELKKQLPDGYVLLEDAILTNIASASTQTKVGTVAKNFSYQATVTANALAFKKADLDQFVKDYIISQIPEGKTLLQDSQKTEYTSNLVDVSGGKATIKVTFSSDVYQNIDRNSMALSLLGQSEDQIRQNITGSLGDQASDIKVKFWPFWVTSAPNNQKAVNVYLNFQK